MSIFQFNEQKLIQFQLPIHYQFESQRSCLYHVVSSLNICILTNEFNQISLDFTGNAWNVELHSVDTENCNLVKLVSSYCESFTKDQITSRRSMLHKTCKLIQPMYKYHFAYEIDRMTENQILLKNRSKPIQTEPKQIKTFLNWTFHEFVSEHFQFHGFVWYSIFMKWIGSL